MILRSSTIHFDKFWRGEMYKERGGEGKAVGREKGVGSP